MSLTDFRDQLEARATGSDRQQPDPLPVLRSRIRTTKRRRTVVTAAGAALTVGLVATVIPAGLDRLGGSEPSPASPAPAGPPDVVKDGIRFPGTIGGDTLLKAVIGDVGQEFSFDLDVPAGETEIRPFCVLPGPADYTKLTNWVHVLVDGQVRVTSPCGADQGAKVADQLWAYGTKPGDPGVNVEGMQPGKQARISVRVGSNELGHPPAPNRRARIGVGVYRLGPMQVVERTAEGARIPEVFDHQGHQYRLVDVGSRWATEGAAITVDTPAGTQFLVRQFNVGLGANQGWPKSGVRTLRLTGLGSPISASQRYDGDETAQLMPRIDPVRVETRPVGTATLTLTGPTAPNTKMVLAVYRLVR